MPDNGCLKVYIKPFYIWSRKSFGVFCKKDNKSYFYMCFDNYETAKYYYKELQNIGRFEKESSLISIDKEGWVFNSNKKLRYKWAIF